MSVWLPRRSAHAATISVRQFVSLRSLHSAPARQVPLLLLARPHPLFKHIQSHATHEKRWQSTKESASTTDAGDAKTTAVAPKEDLLGARIWKKVKHEAAHYWNGSKLLVSEVKISARLQWKLLHGETLTRRERRQVSISSMVSIPLLTETVEAEKNDHRHPSTTSLLSIHRCPVHGALAASCAEAVPQYASVDLRGQVCSGKLIS